MAHTWTDTGHSALINIIPQNGTNISSFYIGLFGSQTSGTVPNRTAFEGATPGGWVESVNMARDVVSAAQWGAPSIAGGGTQSTGRQVAFTATGAGSANGYFISNRVSAIAGAIVLGFSNFDDLSTVSYNSGDVIRMTPTWKYNVSAGTP